MFNLILIMKKFIKKKINKVVYYISMNNKIMKYIIVM